MPDIHCPTIILIGPEGAGITTIAKVLSEKLDRELFSLDRNRKELYSPFNYDDAYANKLAVVDILQNAIKPGDRFHGKILDFGAGHSIFENKEELDHVTKLIAPYKGVFLILPCEDVDEALRIMEERRRHELSYNRHFLDHPSNKTLAKHIIYTKDISPEQSAAKILEFLGG